MFSKNLIITKKQFLSGFRRYKHDFIIATALWLSMVIAVLVVAVRDADLLYGCGLLAISSVVLGIYISTAPLERGGADEEEQ